MRRHRPIVNGIRRLRVSTLGLAVLLGSVSAHVALASDTPTLTVLAISAADSEAVIRVDGEAPAVHGLGDELADGRFEVRKVLTDRVEFEERPRDGRPVRDVWVYVADESGVSRVRRIEQTASDPPPPEILVPIRPGQPGEQPGQQQREEP